MPAFTHLIKLVLPVLAVFALAACATPDAPSQELALANAEIDQALRAGATEHAPDTLADARQKLELARDAVDDGEMDLARRLAQQAQLDARLALAQTSASESQEALAAVDESLDALRNELNP
jgi:hypothetical protein